MKLAKDLILALLILLYFMGCVSIITIGKSNKITTDDVEGESTVTRNLKEK